jgi:AbrB family looped-hinge helix DNA binding protein
MKVRTMERAMSTEATLTSKGQTTIPKPIRDSLGMKAGDRMSFTLMADGVVVMRVKTNVLVRYLVRDDRAQYEKARRLIDREVARGEPILVSLLVLLETAFDGRALKLAGFIAV